LLLIVQAALAAHYLFQQSIAQGVISQIKLSGVLFYFFAAWLIASAHIRLRDLSVAIHVLGTVTIIAWIVLLVLVDWSSIASTEELRFLLFDEFRGMRFGISTVFVELLLFFHLHSFIRERDYSSLIILGIIFLLLLLLVQSRNVLLFCGIVVAFNVFRPTVALTSRGALVIILFAVGAMAIAVLDVGAIGSEAIAGSYALRLETAKQMLAFFQREPVVLLFGSGNLSPFHEVSFADLFGPSFWISDVGWLGVVFEYGLVGVIVFLALYVRLLIQTNRLCRANPSPMAFALRDFSVKTLIASILVPTAPFLLGQVVTILAFATELLRAHLKLRNTTIG
jgi:hypothetical protein